MTKCGIDHNGDCDVGKLFHQRCNGFAELSQAGLSAAFCGDIGPIDDHVIFHTPSVKHPARGKTQTSPYDASDGNSSPSGCALGLWGRHSDEPI